MFNVFDLFDMLDFCLPPPNNYWEGFSLISFYRLAGEEGPIDYCDQESQFLDFPWGNILLLRIGCDVLEY